jgi:hypothetical protein
LRPKNPEDEVLTTCSSLIAIVNVGSSRVIQFSHYSVKEYLMPKLIAEPRNAVPQYQVFEGPAHAAVAHACLAVLLKLSPNSNKSTIEEDVPLALYAARHWLDHALQDEVSPDIQDGLTEFFNPNKPHFVVWAWICDTIPGFSLGTAFEGVWRLLQKPLDDGVFRDFRDAGVLTVSYACTLHYTLDLKRDTSVLYSLVLQTAYMPLPAPKEAGPRCVGTSTTHTWAKFVPHRSTAKMLMPGTLVTRLRWHGH